MNWQSIRTEVQRFILLKHMKSRHFLEKIGRGFLEIFNQKIKELVSDIDSDFKDFKSDEELKKLLSRDQFLCLLILLINEKDSR